MFQGCKYDYKIDMWSLGCILAELWTGNVLFQNDTVQGLLARVEKITKFIIFFYYEFIFKFQVIGIIGPFPERLFKEARLVQNFFTRERLLFQDVKTNS